MLKQRTLSSKIKASGVGLHTGKKISLTLNPAPINSGISFLRTDIKAEAIKASLENVFDTRLSTTLSNSHVKISTVEHLLSALAGLGIDNARIELDGPEVPIMDGSAKIFVEKVLNVGIEVSDTPIKIIKIEKEIELSSNGKNIKIKPSKLSLDIDFEIKYTNPLIGTQRNSIDVYKSNLEDIYSSRTFCLFEDIEKLKKMNLAKGGSLENAIVVKENKILNVGGLRNEKEFVNHKILDCIGDLFLSGHKVISKIVCSQGGHKLTNQLLRKVFSDHKNFSILEIKEKNIPHSFINRNFLKSIA